MRLLDLAFVFMIVPVASASTHDLMITGVMDGTLTGGAPKVVELYALTDVVDLSQYALSRAGNGNADFDAIDVGDPNDPNDLPSTLPAISLNTGDFYYAVGSSFSDMTSTFDTIFPSKSGIRVRNSAVNSNGDDVTGLFFDPSGMFAGSETLIDVFGELGVDGTGEAWEHTDGWSYRNNDRRATIFFDPGHWTHSGRDALDRLSAMEIADSFPDMTFVPTLPVGDPISFSWKSDQSGDWQQSGNWDPVGMPNAVNHSATFGDVISTTQTVFTNVPVSVREVQFDSVQGYVVAGAGTIHVSLGTSSATTISALQGTNQFQAAVKLLANTSVDVSGAAAVIFNNALDVNGNTLTKLGEGTLIINNQLFMGGAVVVAAGVVGGGGTIQGNVKNSGGTLAPGSLAENTGNLQGVPEPSGLCLLLLPVVVCLASRVCGSGRRAPGLADGYRSGASCPEFYGEIPLQSQVDCAALWPCTMGGCQMGWYCAGPT